MPSTTLSVVLSDGSTAAINSQEDLAHFYNALGYTFREISRLMHALTHRSWCAENPGNPSNERLEFLGDAILGDTITKKLFHDAPDRPEGELAKARAEVVSAASLGAAARRVGVGAHLRLGRGEELSGGREKESILADAMEAVFAAVYLDGGDEAATQVIVGLFGVQALEALESPGERDFKTRLQERASELGFPAPVYELASSGPDHGRRFNAKVTVGATVGAGSGSSKKQAEQNAADEALRALGSEETE